MLSATYTLHYQSGLPPEGKGKHCEAEECTLPDGADIPTSQVRSGQVDGRRRTRRGHQYNRMNRYQDLEQ